MKKNIPLIRNTYDAKEARIVLLQLLNDKIKFLGQRKFGQFVRAGIDDEKIEQRIQELHESRKELIQLFDSLNDKEVEFEIDCPINITILEKSAKKESGSVHDLAKA
ncbi:MAG: hypothetical protein RIC15_01635 [Vicingaceae bacterium]